jgi:hypothetical protein
VESVADSDSGQRDDATAHSDDDDADDDDEPSASHIASLDGEARIHVVNRDSHANKAAWTFGSEGHWSATKRGWNTVVPYINAEPKSDCTDGDEDEAEEAEDDSKDGGASAASAADLQLTEGEENTVGEVEIALAFVHNNTRRWCISLRKACDCLTLAELSRESRSDSGCSKDSDTVAAETEEGKVDILSAGCC